MKIKKVKCSVCGEEFLVKYKKGLRGWKLEKGDYILDRIRVNYPKELLYEGILTEEGLKFKRMSPLWKWIIIKIIDFLKGLLGKHIYIELWICPKCAKNSQQ